MFDEVFRMVCGDARVGAVAVVQDYARYAVRGQSFPAIVRESGAHTQGLLFHDIELPMWTRLDAFEGDLYQRIEVSVLTEKAMPLSAQTYVFAASGMPLLTSHAWNPESFATQDLPGFVQRHAS